jgi:hypothetical protein
MVGLGRNWTPPAEGGLIMPSLHNLREAVVRDKARTMLY